MVEILETKERKNLEIVIDDGIWAQPIDRRIVAGIDHSPFAAFPSGGLLINGSESMVSRKNRFNPTEGMPEWQANKYPRGYYFQLLYVEDERLFVDTSTKEWISQTQNYCPPP